LAPELPEGRAGSGSVTAVLEELHAEHDECGQFFGDVFDQLQSLSLELFARHRCLELAAKQQTEREAAASQSGGQFEQLVQEVHDTQTQMREFQSQVQQAWDGVRKALKELETRSESAQAGGVDQERLDQILDDARQQRTVWEQERAALEAELETVRNRSAELAETLAEQKRLSAQQQAEWSSELKRMRSLLEAISGQMVQDGSGPAVARSARGETVAGTAADPVLDSVMAQFAMLQQEVTQRRAARSGRN
jgi:chromosome segregation ATPase